ncbi:MAG: hypothetical protein ACR2JZ_06340 [Candidatus Limnocylindrales bacterium]
MVSSARLVDTKRRRPQLNERTPGSPGGRRPEYKGAPLDEARGPGLGCFWLQLALLVVLLVLTPLGVAWGWPSPLTGGLLIATLVLLFFSGQTLIFLLRLVAADRRNRRRPLRSTTRTVGELESDEEAPGAGGMRE